MKRTSLGSECHSRGCRPGSRNIWPHRINAAAMLMMLAARSRLTWAAISAALATRAAPALPMRSLLAPLRVHMRESIFVLTLLTFVAPAQADLFPCSEAGLDAAIAAAYGGDSGPHELDCLAGAMFQIIDGRTIMSRPNTRRTRRNDRMYLVHSIRIYTVSVLSESGFQCVVVA